MFLARDNLIPHSRQPRKKGGVIPPLYSTCGDVGGLLLALGEGEEVDVVQHERPGQVLVLCGATGVGGVTLDDSVANGEDDDHDVGLLAGGESTDIG